MPHPIRRLRIPLAFGCAVAVGAVAIGSVLPPPVWPLVVLRIVGAGFAAWLVVGAALAIVAAAWPAPRRGLRHATLIIGGAALAIVAYPIASLPTIAARARTALDAGFGVGWDARLAADHPERLRAAPFAWREALTGLAVGASAGEERIAIPDATGAPLAAAVHRPRGVGPAPMVVTIHGGGWRGGSIDECATVNRWLAGHGYLVVAIGYRLAPRYRFPAQLDDVRAALVWLRAHAGELGGDPRRLALMGRSAGGELALLAAADQPSPARAVVSWYGPADLDGGYRRPPRPDPADVRAILSGYLGGTPDELPAAYRDASPIAHADHRGPPTLILAGGADHLVALDYQLALVERLRAAGTPAALVEIPWAEHAFDAVPQGPGGQLALFELARFLAWALA